MADYAVIIVGGGPAGLSAAIYTCRKSLKTLVLTSALGGQCAITDMIENYPGYKKVNGLELMMNFEEQATSFGAKIEYAKVEKVSKKGEEFTVNANGKDYTAKTVVLAFGKTPRELDVPGEKQFIGKGVTYCATCDAPLYKGKACAVVGGGNSAFEAALLLSRIGASKIYLNHRRDEFRGDEYSLAKIKSDPKIELVCCVAPVEVKGDKFVKSLVVENVNDKKKRELVVEGIFVEIGYEVKTDFLGGLAEIDDLKQIKVNVRCETSTPGLFAAGDVTSNPFKQVVIAAGEGARAGMQAYNYLTNLKGPISADWAKEPSAKK